MSSDATNKRRRKLSRAYELTSELRLRVFGFHQDRGLSKSLGTIRRFAEYQFLSHYFGTPPLWRMILRQLSGRRTLPDFCIVGPIKSGTSDLAVNLLLHPNVLAPFAKEFHIADPAQWRIYYPTQKQKRRHMERHGVALSPFLAPYLHWMELTYNLSCLSPAPRVVLTLREPAARIYSQWKWEKFLSGRVRGESMPFLATFDAYASAALASFPEYPMYTACGFPPIQTSIYWKAVRYWIECFGRSNVLVVDIAHYFDRPNDFLRQIEEFVGLPTADLAVPGKPVNENPLRLPPPDASTIENLRAFFRPHNQRLWSVIGKEFDW